MRKQFIPLLKYLKNSNIILNWSWPSFSKSVNLHFVSVTTNISKMQVFTPCLNPVTGEKEWSLQPEDYDFKQEIARSSYADMLHDKERNEMYFEGIRRSVSLLKSQGKEVHVLDIGTGTGLLSLMAVILWCRFSYCL
ncbi:Protein arginine N-methyltransferase 7 [Armadillidium vulgare]|nr:Protein arginine N-methyltransferase 7 [Armadillidium vulgare]